jgi:RNA polymerase sigma factor (sigma-70 family)
MECLFFRKVFMTEEDIIRGCLKYDHACQRELYDLYFAKMMHVCLRYAKDPKEAKSILLNGFKNIFNEFRSFSDLSAKTKNDAPAGRLGQWIKKEIIASAIQYMHSNKKEYFVSSTVSIRDSEKQANGEIPDEQIIKSATKQMVMNALRELTPSYRAIYNLHEMDGYSHQEISVLLDISEYTSKDSLSKAKFNLRKNLVRMVSK